MKDYPIKLVQQFSMGGLTTLLSTDPKISNKQMFTFFKDLEVILREIDPEINNDPKVYVNWRAQDRLRFVKIPFLRYQSMIQSFHVDDRETGECLRYHNVEYIKDSTKRENDFKQKMKGNLFQNIPLFSNISITSNNMSSNSPPYDPNDFKMRIASLPYVSFEDTFSHSTFDPMTIAKASQKRIRELKNRN